MQIELERLYQNALKLEQLMKELHTRAEIKRQDEYDGL